METPNLVKLGELAKQSLAEVPARYIGTDQDLLTNVTDTCMKKVPVIDLVNLLSPEPEIGELESERLHSACKEWGVFQVVNHGVDILLVEKVKLEIEGFFNIPIDEKKKFWQEEGDLEGFGQAFVHSEDQKLDWGDMFFMLTLPRHMRKPRLFPKLPLPLRDTMESYSLEVSKLGMTLLELMEKALQIETGVMTELFKDGRQTMRMNYYPPCPLPEHVLGLAPHSDGSGLTILLQVNQVEGLQIRKKNMWIPFMPLPKAFLVIIGDLLERGAPRTVSSTKEWLSVATTHSPNMKSEIGPISSMITPETPALFRTVRYEDYLRKYYTRPHSGKSFYSRYYFSRGCIAQLKLRTSCGG
ncbi:hypothetical protein C5167_017895 [Papaver somniferum]|uniref:Fe2OG dioxygenase domain-containing protein n=1 Tax=Papaver somniferum TaxID=3469 RepID=A0A4Y7INS7_PAPSO|nr:hypothetical protein C5167_017895 [Papaver somniferum]